MPSKNGYIAAGVVTAGLLTAGGVSMASATTSTAPTGSGYGQSAPAEGQPNQGQNGQAMGPGGQGRHQMGTRVTGDEAAKVTAAVKAKDASATVDAVMKEPKGDYHVMATENGKRTGFKVSKDLKTVEKMDLKGQRGRGPGARHLGSPVSKAVSQKVAAAVKAKDSGVAVKHVFKRADGSYEVFGLKDGKPAPFKVSKDLKTVTQETMPQMGKDGHGRPGDAKGGPGKGGQGMPGPGDQNGKGNQGQNGPGQGGESSPSASSSPTA